jgi:outer membrane lipoprotein-sorting protein
MEDRKDFNPDELLDRAVDALLREPVPDGLSPDRVAQLAAEVRHAAEPRSPIALTKRIKNMRSSTKIAVAASALIVLVGLTSWLVPGSGAALAFGDVAEALTNVQTARWKSTSVVKRPEGQTTKADEIGMFMAPSHERTERTQGGVMSISIIDGQTDKVITLAPAGKIAMVLKLENFPPEAPLGTRFLDLRESALRAKSGEAGKVESLGVKVIDGRRAEGFRLQIGATEVEIWADPKTSLPIRVEQVTSGATEVRIVMTDFEVDVDLDESLFSLDPPEGYTVQQMQLELPKKPLVLLARTLGMVAEVNGGVFPPTLRGEQGIDGVGPRVAEAWKRKYGNDALDSSKATANIHELQKATSELAMNLGGAFGILNALSPKHDWHYAGKDVKLNTPNQAIFWWKPQEDGDYEVIYADLSVKDVAPQDMPNVSPPEGNSNQQ